MTVKLKAQHRGPLVVSFPEGTDVALVGTDREPIDLDGRTRLLICRCGQSKNAPLCDGTHYKTDFEAPPADAEGGEG